MAIRRPLCAVSGRVKELPANDILPIGFAADSLAIWTPGGSTIEVWCPLADMRGTSTGTSLTAKTFIPFYVTGPVTLDRIGIVVASAAAGAGEIGIYASSSRMPDARLVAASLDFSTTGFKTATIDLTLQPGLYYAAMAKNAAADIVSFRGGTASRRIAGNDGLLYTSFTNTSTDGALPDPAPTITLQSNALVPQIVVRRSA